MKARWTEERREWRLDAVQYYYYVAISSVVIICTKQIYLDTKRLSISSQPNDYDDQLDNV